MTVLNIYKCYRPGRIKIMCFRPTVVTCKYGILTSVYLFQNQPQRRQEERRKEICPQQNTRRPLPAGSGTGAAGPRGPRWPGPTLWSRASRRSPSRSRSRSPTQELRKGEAPAGPDRGRGQLEPPQPAADADKAADPQVHSNNLIK